MSVGKRLLQNLYVKRWLYFFPLQLVWVHLKNNHFIIMFWLVILGFITGNIASNYGIQHLFLSPEYLHHVSLFAYFIMGFSYGGFVMAFNISSYIMNGHRFAFLATLSRPFIKYCVNNSILPIIGIVIYLWNVVKYYINETNEGWLYIGGILLVFIAGYVVNIFLCFAYFSSTNKDIKKMFGVDVAVEQEHEEAKDEDDIDLYPDEKQKAAKTIKGVLHKKVEWDDFINIDREWNVSTYLSSPFKIRLARNIDHYDNKMLKQVFDQNHLNAALFEILIFLSIIGLSFMSDIHYFIIPAGASLILLFTLFLMLDSAIHSWFRGWATAVLLGLFLLFNYLSQFDFFDSNNKAYGLNYNSTKANFSSHTLSKNINAENYVNDFNHTISILDNWRKKNNKNSMARKQKPKLVFVNCSGGGLRASLWTFYTMTYADSVLNGQLLNHTQMFTGSSGGMVGAAYLRELYLRKQQGKIDNLYAWKYRENISKDLLNKLSFHVTLNDLIFKFRSFNDGEYKYKIDRGYAFESDLNENTEHVMEKRLWEYTEPENQALIPMLIMAPTIINDGSKLLISSQPISYLSYMQPKNNIRSDYVLDAIEFRRFFREQDADNLRFTSALRMSATFPFIMPIASLPSDPEIQVMDAGVRDNFGIQTSLKFIYTYRNWISTNTSGIIFVQIRDSEKSFTVSENKSKTFMQSLFSPVGSIYGNMFRTQDMNHDQLLQYCSEWFDGEIDVVNFELPQGHGKHKELSLSWHLTDKEKEQIINAMKLPKNQDSMDRLRRLML
ncbi:MAG: patatin-like phospholipase family protein [Flavobacteriales bacterium]